jgi:hypothetical protein
MSGSKRFLCAAVTFVFSLAINLLFTNDSIAGSCDYCGAYLVQEFKSCVYLAGSYGCPATGTSPLYPDNNCYLQTAYRSAYNCLGQDVTAGGSGSV